MAFNFKWSEFSDEFYEQTKAMLSQALNKGPRPDVVVDYIEVHEFNFGSIAPELEILEIGDLTEERFRGMLKLTYEGDAFLVLRTQVQVNPMQIKSEISIQARRGVLAAHQPLVVPMLLRISHLRLRGIISLSVSPQNGVTLVFKNDPLQGVEVSSTFDELGSVKEFLQSQIEDTLRSMFQEDLPRLIHSMSGKLRSTNSSQSPHLDRTQTLPPFSPTHSLSPDALPCNHSSDSNSGHHLETLSLPDLPISPKCFPAGGVVAVGLGSSFRSPPLPRRNNSLQHLPRLHKKWGSSTNFVTSELGSGCRSPPRHNNHSFQKSVAYHRVGPVPLTKPTLHDEGLKSLIGVLSPRQ